MIETDRLILRGWQESDVLPFYQMGQDMEVMRYLGPPASMDDAVRARERMSAVQSEQGHCFWAVERKDDHAFIGFCGLLRARAPIEGEIEIGWRLARSAWGQGYAHEAARASLGWGWVNLDVPTIAAITVDRNERSWRLMERLGMTRAADGDFDHPDLKPDDPLRRHILYRIARPQP